jgi:uncharacterized membrane protein
MMGFDGYGLSPWMWILGSLMMVIVIGALILLVVWAVKIVGRPSPASNTPLDVLKRRLAAGEITHDEYENTRRLIEG